MTLIRFLFLAISLLLVSAMDHVMYEGLRLDMSALTLNRDILATITPALNRTLYPRYPDIREKGAFWSEYSIKNIKVVSYKINEERFDMMKYEYKYPIYKLKGSYEAIYFHITFDCERKILGIPITKAKGEADVTNVNNEVLVFFNESDPDVQIPHPWDVRNVTTSSVFISSSWVKGALHTHFIPPFHDTVDGAMFDFAHNLLKPYRFIEDIFPHDIDLIFRNDILSVTPTVEGSFLSIAFKTNMTVNGYIQKKMYRKVNGTVVPKGDFDYCLNAQLVPDVLDALGKGGYYDTEVMPQLMGFATDTVKEVFDILPSLKDRYKGDEKFTIHCQTSRFESVNDLTQRGLYVPLLQLQLPEYCFFYTLNDGEYFLIVDTFMRFYYDMVCKDEAFYGHIDGVELYGFRTVPDLPETKRQKLATYLEEFTKMFHDADLISPGIKVNPNRHEELEFDWYYSMTDEICFYYKEKRPILNKN